MRSIREEQYQMSRLIEKRIQKFSIDNKEYFDIKRQEGLFLIDEIMFMLKEKPEDERTEVERQIFKEAEDIFSMIDDFDDMVDLNRIRVFNSKKQYGKY